MEPHAQRAAKRALVQRAIVPGEEAGEYSEPDLSAGDAWPGRQTPTRQLTLFAMRAVVCTAAVDSESLSDDPDTQPMRRHRKTARRACARSRSE